MLTGSLLLYTTRAGKVRPRLLDPADAGLLSAAAGLAGVVAAHVGHRRGELEQTLRGGLPPGGSNSAVPARAVPGLARLLLERCAFETECPVEPARLRAALFDAAAAAWQREGLGVAKETGVQEESAAADRAVPAWRAGVLEAVGGAHALSAQAIETGLFADLEENQVLRGWEPIGPQALIERFNVAQVQGLLLRAERLTLEAPWPTPQRLRQLLRWMKFFGLLFRQEPTEEGRLRLAVDGPLSLLESATRYGLDLARFFPALLLWREPWRLEAELQPRANRVRATLTLEPHPWLRSHYPDHGQWVPEEARRFIAAFAASPAGAGWRVEAAEDLLALPGNRFLLPDFRAVHTASGRTTYIEQLPYPSLERVRQRGALIAAGGRRDYIVACRALPSLAELGAPPPWLLTYRRSLLPSLARTALERLALEPIALEPRALEPIVPEPQG